MVVPVSLVGPFAGAQDLSKAIPQWTGARGGWRSGTRLGAEELSKAFPLLASPFVAPVARGPQLRLRTGLTDKQKEALPGPFVMTQRVVLRLSVCVCVCVCVYPVGGWA